MYMSHYTLDSLVSYLLVDCFAVARRLASVGELKLIRLPALLIAIWAIFTLDDGTKIRNLFNNNRYGGYCLLL